MPWLRRVQDRSAHISLARLDAWLPLALREWVASPPWAPGRGALEWWTLGSPAMEAGGRSSSHSSMIPEQTQGHSELSKQVTMSSTNTWDGREVLGARGWTVIG